ncbi:MAG: TonB-dependent receptor [Lutibacter sp.]|uniref:TonB-dependent receptor n=1 Tax=Lutibacter sp. TaxID=1925666 RepID=UPI0019DC3094|nr:TonB-dependent receptor [Lutibacter sp.]NOR27474.1 TonB-dependent receptor [Lutibacter sp.]
MKLNYYWLLILLISQQIFAQNTVKGTIKDITSYEALPYVSVYLPEYNKGTQTNDEGFFELNNLPIGEIKIQFSFLGYTTIIKTISVTEHKEIQLNINMESNVFQVEEIVISGGTYSTQHENAIKIELVKASELSSTGAQSFTEAIVNIPGVDMISKGTGVVKPVIRGLSMTNILLLNNGVKMENFQFSENHPFIIDEFGIDRIEIIKGPASLLYGSDAVGGVINVLKEKPAPVGSIIGDFNSQYHSNTEGIISNFGIKGSANTYFWGIRAGVKSHTDYKDGNGNYILNTRFNEYSFKSNFGINKSYGVFHLNYDYNAPKFGMSIGDAFPFITENGRENNYWYQDLTNHVISTKNTIFINKYSLNVNASYQLNNRALQTDETKPVYEMVNIDSNTFSYEAKVNFSSSNKTTYILGVQGALNNIKNNDAPNHLLPNADVKDYAIFGFAQFNLFKKIKAQTGIRYDYKSIITEPEPSREAVDTNFGDISTSFGATYNLTDKILFRTNVASAFRTPNIAELTQNGIHGGRYEQGNPNLKSQRSYEVDASSHYHSKKIMIDISGFYNNINDYIFIAPFNETTANGDIIYKYTQSNAKIVGGEIAVDILPFKWLVLKTSYAYLHGKQSDGNYLPFIPQNKLRFHLKFKKDEISFLDAPFFKIGGTVASKQTKPAMFETTTNGYFLMNLGLGASIKAKRQPISFSIQVNNIFNKTYIDHLSTLKELDFYNIGRNISFNLKIPFSIK